MNETQTLARFRETFTYQRHPGFEFGRQAYLWVLGHYLELESQLEDEEDEHECEEYRAELTIALMKRFREFEHGVDDHGIFRPISDEE
ncbi:unnamed protein product [Caenorhabditis bovis]|uniref:Uncharacterized protein n=1 Tax=Caenorhabditis bovis TaxID=2654633 RepID=A0A8S1EFR0_9PELO|nr:unnamed protein product [Caenorhabditis bovis]